MKKFKKFLAVASVAAMTLSLCACGGKKDDTYTVGICQLVQHEALDAATKGFKDALVEEFGEDGIKFDEQNAQGDANTCATIINGFVSSDVDLILANATPALQAIFRFLGYHKLKPASWCAIIKIPNGISHVQEVSSYDLE